MSSSRTTRVTADLVKKYQDMISATISDLNDRLEKMKTNLDHLPPQSAGASSANSTERKRIQEEIESTKQCLSICTAFSRDIDRIRPSIFKNIAIPPGTVDQSAVSNVGPVTAQFMTNQTLESCDTVLKNQVQQLQKHLQDLFDQLIHLQSNPNGVRAEDETERQRIQDELEATKQSLAICAAASERATKNRLNVYEDVLLEEDGRQYIVSTIGDLISAKRISAGARSTQCLGQVSDESFQKMLVVSTSQTSGIGSVDVQKPSNTEFKHRYGTGFKLNMQSPAGSGVDP
jgi:predicted  nucleic acid-binding Zn-ribbon protein